MTKEQAKELLKSRVINLISSFENETGCSISFISIEECTGGGITPETANWKFDATVVVSGDDN